MDIEALEQEIARCLKTFYISRFQGLEKLSLGKVLSKKNPYLYRALGVEKASEIVEQNMAAFVISSDETIFGNCFFEPLAKLAAGGKVSDAEGVDFTVEFPDRYLAVAVKSGPNWGNRDQHKRQSTNFDSLRNRLYKIQKQFDPVVGQAYGRQSSEPTENSRFRRRSGQAFWQEITGDPDFYLKLVRLMKDVPAKNRPKYRALWNQAVNKFTAEFIRDFCDSAGANRLGKTGWIHKFNQIEQRSEDGRRNSEIEKRLGYAGLLMIGARRRTTAPLVMRLPFRFCHRWSAPMLP